jgi:hypothetical protein
MDGASNPYVKGVDHVPSPGLDNAATGGFVLTIRTHQPRSLALA